MYTVVPSDANSFMVHIRYGTDATVDEPSYFRYI